jgi:hypothetical protein
VVRKMKGQLNVAQEPLPEIPEELKKIIEVQQ